MIKMDFNGNKKLGMLMKIVNKDVELQTLWKCSNVNAIDRSGITDHGPIHIKIVTNMALKIMRLLVKGGVKPSCVLDYGLGNDDAEMIVVLASMMHDLGVSVHREQHEEYSLFLASGFLDRFLPELYGDAEERTVVKSEVLHAIISHSKRVKPYTIEAGVVKLADALDMEQGRARIAFNIGKVDIHSVSALAIESVSVGRGKKNPVEVRIKMMNSAGIFQIDELLRMKMENNPVKEHISIVVDTSGAEKKIIDTFELSW